MSEVRKMLFDKERIPHKRFSRLAYRRQESHHTHESSTLQVQMRWLRLRSAGEDTIRYWRLLIYTSFCKIRGRYVAVHDLKRCCSQIGC